MNWIKATKDIFKQGLLPPLMAPVNVQDSKYCQVTVNDGPGLDVTFTVKCVLNDRDLSVTCF